MKSIFKIIIIFICVFLPIAATKGWGNLNNMWDEIVLALHLLGGFTLGWIFESCHFDHSDHTLLDDDL